MVAFNARRLVWLAMALISWTTWPTRSAAAAMSPTFASVAEVRSTASRAATVARDTCWPISAMLADICSAAAATALRFRADSIAPSAVFVASARVRRAASDISPAVARMVSAD